LQAAGGGLASCTGSSSSICVGARASGDALAVETCNRRLTDMRCSRDAPPQLSESSKFGARRGDRREKTRVKLKWLTWTRTCFLI
jgi:hypothetical protein